MAISKSTREEFYEFLDLSGVDDSEKDELKSTLYDNNGNTSNTTTGGGAVDSLESGSSSGRNNNYKNNRSSPGGRGVSRGGGGFGSGQNQNRNQQQYRQSSTSLPARETNTCQSSGSTSYVKNRPKPTTWVTNRKFQLQSSAASSTSSQQQQQQPINKTNTAVVASKRYAYQYQQQQQQQQPLNHKSSTTEKYNSSNNNSGVVGVSDNFSSIEYNHHPIIHQHHQDRSNKNRAKSQRNYDVNSDTKNTGTSYSSSTKIVPNPHHRRANSANSSYSTDSTSVDYSCDETSYASTPFSTTIEEVVMPRLLTPLATLPLYAVVKPTLAATAILQPQTALITQQQIPQSVTSVTTSQPTVIRRTSSSSKHVPESVSTECAEVNTDSEDQIHHLEGATSLQQEDQLNNFSQTIPDSQVQMINNQNHPGAMSQQQQQQQQQQQPPPQQQQPPPSQHPQGPVFVHPSTGSYAMYQAMPMMPPPGNVFVSNVTANVSVHGLMQPVQHLFPYMPAQDVAQNPVTGHEGQAQQAPQPMVNSQMRGQNRRGRGRTSSGSNSQRREFVPRANNQQEIPQSVIDPQAQMIAGPPGQHYQYYVQYPYHYVPQGQAGVQHPNAPPATAPVYLQHMPMYSAPSMYGYQHMYPVMPHEYLVDEKVVDEQGAESVQQMWSPNHDYQDAHQMEQVPLQEEYVTQQMAPQPEDILIAEEINQQNAQNTIQIQQIHQPIQLHHPSVPHSVLNPNVPNFTVVSQPVAVQNEQVPVPPPQHYNANAVVPTQAQVPQDFAMTPQGSISPIAANVVAQSYANVSQHLAIATSNENNEQTFIQAASAVTVVNTSSTYAMAESIPGIKTVTQIEHEAVTGVSGDQIVDDYVQTNDNNTVKSNKVPSSVSVQQHQQPSPLPQRVRDTPIHINAQPFVPQGVTLTKTVSSGSLTSSNVVLQEVASNNTVPNQVLNASSSSNNDNVLLPPTTPNTQATNKPDCNRPTKPAEKNIVTKSDPFGGASNAKPVAWSTSKKNTASVSVSVSAVPAKESQQTNKTATVSPTVSTHQSTGNVSTVATAAKLNPFTPNFHTKGNTSPVPTKQTLIKQEKPLMKTEEVKPPMFVPQPVEVKKVEQQNKEVTANVTEKRQTLSLAPPPPPVTSNADENKQAPAKSWASLFAGGASTPKPTALPSSAVPGDTPKRPVAKVSPFDSTSTTASTHAGPYISSAPHGLSSQGIPQQKSTMEKKPVADEYSLKLSNFLQNYKIDNNSISIFPRGLINRSNYCYINGILQALVSCPPFYHLMRDMPKLSNVKSKGCTPILEAMQDLIAEFQPRKVMREKGASMKDIELVTDSPFEPTVIYKMLSNIRSEIFHVEGRQEDAEEFLGCILNKLNDEMLEIIKLTDKPPVAVKQPAAPVAPKKEEIPNGEHNGEVNADADGDDWKVINSRNKGTITRTTDYARTPISDIFRGKLRSRVTREGDHSTDNIQPFFTLQLDIERANSVKEALDLLVGRDVLEGVTSSKTNQEVTAWQQVTIEELPVILILHLKCFDYKQDGCTKILKALEFPVELKIDTKLMSSKTKYSMKQRTYKLFAVVYHDGKEASKGHYLTDAFHIGYSSWIRYDDSSVKLVNDNQVLKPIPPRVPYLLCYRRYDTISTAQANNNNSNNNNNNSNSQQQQQQRNNYHHK